MAYIEGNGARVLPLASRSLLPWLLEACRSDSKDAGSKLNREDAGAKATADNFTLCQTHLPNRSASIAPREAVITPRHMALAPEQAGVAPRAAGIAPKHVAIACRQAGVAPRAAGIAP